MTKLNKALKMIDNNHELVIDYLNNWKSDESIVDVDGTLYQRDFDICLDNASNEALLHNVLFIVGAGAVEDNHDNESRLFNKIAKLVNFKDESKLTKYITKNVIDINDKIENKYNELFFRAK